jgi:hypothetical protein
MEIDLNLKVAEFRQFFQSKIDKSSDLTDKLTMSEQLNNSRDENA